MAGLLRDRRRALGWTLRDVQERSRSLGEEIPPATLTKVERGKVDPGLRRLHILSRLYDLPLRLVEDLLDLEEFSTGALADVPAAVLSEEALRRWKAGDLREGFSALAALRSRLPDSGASRAERQKALLRFAIAVGSLGKFRLAQNIVDDLLLEPPEPALLGPVLVQAAVCWHWLGSAEAALGFLSRAEANAEPGNHQHLAWVFHERASTFASIGKLDEAEADVKRAIERYRLAGDTYGESRALGVGVRLLLERRDFAGARAAALTARKHAEEHGFDRLAVMRKLDEGRALLDLGEQNEGLELLSAALAEAIAAQDSLTRFYAHYYLWKAYAGAGDEDRSDVELNAARYFVRFVDAHLPEAVEIRELQEAVKVS